jgi:GNAT superfamily N-acetyltransferase
MLDTLGACAIRPARRDEAALLSDLAVRSKATWGYGEAFMHACEPLLRVTPHYIAEHPVFVATAGERVLGFYSLNDERYQLELDLLFVAPDALRGGVGSALCAHALETARAAGFTELFVESDPEAEGFYVRMSGVRVGTVQSTVEQGRELPVLRFDLRSVP